jgi:hypothetical protein
MAGHRNVPVEGGPEGELLIEGCPGAGESPDFVRRLDEQIGISR